MKVLVVGGGTAGLISALILKKHLNVQVDVVQSSKIGIVGVGEGSTEHFKEFMDFVGIDQHSLIKECDVTYKSGIMFEGWAEKPYLHNVSSSFISKYAQYNYVYAKQIAEGNEYFNPKLIWDNQIEKGFLNKNELSPLNQFHFNTYKLNEFLSKKCLSMGMRIFDDEVKDVIINENGVITEIRGNDVTYAYDFYIDSTGFNKTLINKLGGKWASFSKYLKMKAAITFPTEDEENYNLWTLSKTMDNGWLFRLPVWGRYGNGYIFDSDYTDINSVKLEIQTLFKKDIQFGKEFYYNTGALEKSWIGNCVAIGLSSIFVEPLEASSIGSSIQQSFLLMHRLLGYDQTSVNLYNKAFNDMAINIRDFVALHYVTKKDNTEFWRSLKNLDLPDTLKTNLEHWKNHLPINEDFSGMSQYIMFTEAHYTNVLHGLGLFNQQSIKKEYELLPLDLRQDADRIIARLHWWDQTLRTTDHKEHLRLIRDHF